MVIIKSNTDPNFPVLINTRKKIYLLHVPVKALYKLTCLPTGGWGFVNLRSEYLNPLFVSDTLTGSIKCSLCGRTKNTLYEIIKTEFHNDLQELLRRIS